MQILRLAVLSCFLLISGYVHAVSFSGSTAGSPDTDGSYIIKWVPFGTESGPYTLVENGVTVYTGSSTQHALTGKSGGTYNYDLHGKIRVGGWPEPYFVFQKLGSYSVTVSVAPGVPAAPALVASSTSGAYRVSWVQPSGATPTSYVLRRKFESGAWAAIYTGSSLYFDETVTTQGTWYYDVAACTSSGCGVDSVDASVSVNLTPNTPSIPSGPSSTDTHTFSISWLKPTGANTTSYTLRRKQGTGGAWSNIYVGAALTFTDSGRVEGDWYYDVIACNSSYCSPDSADKKIVVDFTGNASGIVGPVIGTNSYSLSFNVSYDTFELQEQSPGGIWKTVATGGSGASTFTGPANNNSAEGLYYYRLKEYVNYDDGSVVFSTPWSSTKSVLRATARVASITPATSTDGSYTLSWAGVSGASKYQYRENGGAWIDSASTSIGFSGRAPGTYGYQVRVCVSTSCNTESASVSTTVNLTPATPGVPIGPSTSGTHTFTISWLKPSGANTTSYTLRRKQGAGGAWSNVYVGSALSFADANRVEGDWYYDVIACNSSYCSPDSGDKKVTVDFTGSASGISGPVIATNTYSLSFTPTFDTYALQEQAPGGAWQTVATGLAGPRTFTGPYNGNSAEGIYYYRLQEYVNDDSNNPIFSTPWSSTKSVVRATARVASVTPATSIDGSYTLSWAGVSGASKYQYRENGGAWIDSASTSVGFSGRAPGTYSYQVRVCVSTSCNTESASVSTTVDLTPAIPAVPTGPSSVGTHTFTISWLKPSGANTTSYTLRRKQGAGGAWVNIPVGSALSFTDTGRAEGDWYYDVTACNGSYCSADSADKKVTVGFGVVSGTISGPSTALAGSGFSLSYNVDWDGFELWEKAPNGIFTKVSQGTIGGAKIFSGPASGNTTEGSYEYRYLQQILNDNNEALKTSDWSPIKSVLLYKTPAAITGFSNSSVTEMGSFNLTWATPSTGGIVSRIELFEQKQDGQDAGVTHSNIASSATSFPLTQKSDGQWLYRIRACGPVDCGAWSANLLVDVLKIPTQVIGLTQTNANVALDGNVLLQWSAAQETVTEYKVKRTGITQATYSAGVATSFAINAIADGSSSFEVQACNARGCNTVWSLAATVNVLKIPLAPQWQTVQANANLGQVSLSWLAPTAGYSVSDVQLQRVVNGAASGWESFGTLLATSESGLVEGVHSYQLRACNANGCGQVVTSANIDVLYPSPVAPTITTVSTDSQGNAAVEWGMSSTQYADYYQVSSDGSAWQTSSASTNHLLTNLTQGEHSISVRACNANAVPNKCATSAPKLAEVGASAPDYAQTSVSLSDVVPDASVAGSVAAHDPIVGVVAGSGGVSGGTASYNFSIALPPGRAGMAPSVSVSYSSKAGNGSVGMGFGLSAGGSISRCGRTLVHDGRNSAVQYNSDDRLCFNGARLLAVSGVYGQQGTSYRTELDAFTRVDQQGGDLNSAAVYFTVVDRSGTEQTFGNTSNARHVAFGLNLPHSWLIAKSEDLANNSMHYTYGNFGSGEKLLTSIEYTGSGDIKGDRKVEFNYELRDDNASAYQAGGLTVQSQILSSIKTYVGAAEVREWIFEYELSAASKRSLLRSVKDCGFDQQGRHCLDPTQIEWLDQAPTFAFEPLGFKTNANATITPALNGIPDQLGLNKKSIQQFLPKGDFDGDGTPDWPWWKVDAEGIGAAVANDSVSNCSKNVSMNSYTCLEADFNNDGKSDHWSKDTGTLRIAYSAGAWFNTAIDMTDTDIALMADANGDGWVDIYAVHDPDGDYSPQPKQLELWLHSGNSSAPYTSAQIAYVFETILPAGSITEVNTTSASPVGDMNGDGYPDLVVYDNELPIQAKNWQGTAQPTPRELLLTQVTATGAVSFERRDLSIHAQGLGYLPEDELYFYQLFMDVNGDGLADWLSWKGQNNHLWLSLNKGDASFTQWQDLGPNSLLAASRFQFSTGNNNDPSEKEAVFYPKYGHAIKQVDYDADGRAELLMPDVLVAEACITLLAPSETFCGDEIYNAAIDKPNNRAVYYPHEFGKHDSNVFTYKAMRFVEDSSGQFSVEIHATPIVGSANDSVITSAFGNGLSDLVFGFGCNGAIASCSIDSSSQTGLMAGLSPGFYINRNQGSAANGERYQPIDMVVAVENALGVRDEWDYRPLTSKDARFHSTNQPFYEPDFGYLGELSPEARAAHFHFTSSMYAVAEHRQTNGVGGTNATQYRYKGALYNWRGRGFQGFTSVIVESLASEQVSRSDFHQIFPLAGQLHKVRQWTTAQAANDNALPTAIDEVDYEWRFWPEGGFNSANDVTVDAPQDVWQVTAAPYVMVQHAERATHRTLTTVQELYTRTQVTTHDQYGRQTLSESEYVEAGGVHSVKADAVTEYDNSYISSGWWDKPSQQVSTQYAVANRTGLAVAVGTDQDQVVTTSYLAWNTALRVPTSVRTQAVGAKWTEATTANFDSYGQPQQVTAKAEGEANRVVQTSYSADGYFSRTVTNALGHSASSEILPATGQPAWVEDANGLKVQFGYDAFGRQTSTQAPGQATAYTSLQWCDLGNCSAAANAKFKTIAQQAGSPTQASYHDLLGRAVLSEVEAFSGLENLVTQVQYNALGQKTFESVPAFNSPSSYGSHYDSYDTRGRLTAKRVDQTDGQVLSTVYSHEQGAGFTTDISANGLNLSRTYNGLGQLTQTVDANSGVTAYAYSGSGQPIVLQDANGNRITASYNALGQKLWVNDPNMGQKAFTYTGFGEVDTETDANGDTTDYNYDLLGRVYERKVNGVREANWVFDSAVNGLGLPAQEQRFDANQNIVHGRTFNYDALSRPSVINTHIDGETFAVTTHYDSNLGRVKGLQYPNGLTLAYGYTDTGYQASVKNAASGYVYREITDQDASGQWRSATMAQGLLNVQRNFDPATGQMRANQLDDPMGSVHRQNYSSFDAFGNLQTQITEVPSLAAGTITETYGYDNLHRLTENHRSNGASIYYDYDAVGNLLQKGDFASSYQYTGAKPNAVSSVDLVAGGSMTYGYDANGNRTHENGAETLRYNAFNKPTRIVRNGATVEFFYGANQMRYKQVAGGKTTLYVDKLFEKISVTGEDQYRLFIEDIAVLTNTVKADGTSSHKIGFTHRDRLGSTVAVSDHLGVLQESQSYDPFGKPRAGDLADLLNAIVNSSFTTRGFTDHEHLDNVKLIHMNGRAYDYELGRFLSVDPVIQAPGNSQSLNPYSYIMNNPMSGTDPTGYEKVSAPENNKTAVHTEKVAVTGSRLKGTVTTTTTTTSNSDGTMTITAKVERTNGAGQQVSSSMAGGRGGSSGSTGAPVASQIGENSSRSDITAPSPNITSDDTDNHFAMNNPDMDTGATRSVGGIEELGEFKSRGLLERAVSRSRNFIDASTLRGSIGLQLHAKVKMPKMIDAGAKIGASAGSTVSSNRGTQGYDIRVESGALLTIPSLISIGGNAVAGYRWGPGFNNRPFAEHTPLHADFGDHISVSDGTFEFSLGAILGVNYQFDVRKFERLENEKN